VIEPRIRGIPRKGSTKPVRGIRDPPFTNRSGAIGRAQSPATKEQQPRAVHAFIRGILAKMFTPGWGTNPNSVRSAVVSKTEATPRIAEINRTSTVRWSAVGEFEVDDFVGIITAARPS